MRFLVFWGQDKKQKATKRQNEDVQDSEGVQEIEQEIVIALRPLNMQDFKEAKNQVNNSNQ